MIRKFKALGLALVAVLALSAVAASAASAEGEFTSNVQNTTATGESALENDTFVTEAGTVECKSHFEGTVAGLSSSQLTVKAKYSGCRAFGFATAHVTMGSCDYLFTTPSEVGSDVWTSTVHVECTNPAEPITITAGNCEVTVGSQTPEGHVIITNDTVAKDVKVQATFSGIHYTVTKDGFLCPFNTGGVVPSTKTGATYTQHKEVTLDSTNGADIHVG